MKRKYVALFILTLTMFLLISCESRSREDKTETVNSGNSIQDYWSQIDEDIMSDSVVDKADIDINEINSEFTLREALSLFGSPRIPETSSDYPFVYSWNIDDDEVLYLIFEKDDKHEFMNKLNHGEYILPEESVQYGEQGIRHLTEHELEVLRDWKLSHKTVCAYVIQNGEKNILFDSRLTETE